LPYAADAGWQQVQLPLTANDPRSVQQSVSGIFAKPLEAFFSNAYHCQPGGHAVPLLSIEAKSSRCRSVSTCAVVHHSAVWIEFACRWCL
jgi:hypothetical protein